MHTIHESARAAKARRKGVPAFTTRDELIVKRHSGPTELPLDTVVIEELGGRLKRTSLDGWQVLERLRLAQRLDSLRAG